VSTLTEWCGWLGQDLFYPPNVGGWPGGRSWLTTRAVLGRANYARRRWWRAIAHVCASAGLCGVFEIIGAIPCQIASPIGVQSVSPVTCDSRHVAVRFPLPTPRCAARHRRAGFANTRTAAAIPAPGVADRGSRRADRRGQKKRTRTCQLLHLWVYYKCSNRRAGGRRRGPAGPVALSWTRRGASWLLSFTRGR
jgi:hypothetical protein